MVGFKLIIVCTIVYTISAQHADIKPTPVPILKQINKHNEDGSYTYGYEGADGSFKIETKTQGGEVKGKYGYVDETGKVRIVEYGANKYGFQPSGEGITVAPPTLVDETTGKDRINYDYEDNQQQVPEQRPYIARVQKGPSKPIFQSSPKAISYAQPEPAGRQYYDAPAPAPAPPRLQIANAAPVDVVYSQKPRPARPDFQYTQSQNFGQNQQYNAPTFYEPEQPKQQQQQQQQHQPQQQQQQPQHQFAYSAPRPQTPVQHAEPIYNQNQQSYNKPQGRTTSVLDQLAKDFALPQSNAQPLHDISFGYY